MRLILASASPRRSEILRSAGYDFEVRAANVDETQFPGESPARYVVRLAREKAEATGATDDAIIIGADTTVVLDDRILAKPADPEDAARMLRDLSGKRHEVLTGVAVHRAGDGKTLADFDRTAVWFAPLSDEWIARYVASGEPLDKAGAYAIQGAAGAFVDRIEGNYLNIVGLPMSLVRRLLETIR